MIGPLWPGSPLYNKSLQDYAFDPVLANQMLDDAGYRKRSDGTRFDFRLIWTANDIRPTKMADVIAQNLAAVGIKTIPMPLERSAVIQKGYINGEFDMIIASFALGPDPDAGTERLYNSSNILPLPNVNNSAYKNPEVDKLFDQQRLQVDFAARKAVYDKIQELIWADIPVFPICAYDAPSIVHGDYVADAFTTFNNIIDNMAAAKPA
jgi:peptide/nickel transport system substrate-binding protein